MTKTALIILAAGNSSRFGSAKQLLGFNNKTLLQHVIDEAIAAGAGPVIVVTGANSNEVLKGIDQHNLQVVFNEHWQNGMASGIVLGVNKAIALNDAVEKIIIAVCDQPFITAGLFKQLNTKQEETGQPIVACAYADTLGTPVLFTQKYFYALLDLKGQEGAKKIVKLHPEDVATVRFPQGHIDIDTQEDYDNLMGKTERP